MRNALGSTVLLWLVALVSLAVRGAALAGFPLGVPAWSGFSRMLEHPWKAPALLALAVATTLALWMGPGRTPRGTRAIGWVVGLLGLASYLTIDAPLAVVLIGTGGMIHRDGRRASLRDGGAPVLREGPALRDLPPA